MTSPKPTDSEQLVASWMKSLGFERMTKMYGGDFVSGRMIVTLEQATFFYRVMLGCDLQRLSAALEALWEARRSREFSLEFKDEKLEAYDSNVLNTALTAALGPDNSKTKEN